MRETIPISQLEDPTTWDDESAVVHRGIDDPQAMISVRFSKQEFDYLSEAAEARGLSLSAFIRSLVLDHLPDDKPSTL